MKIIARITPEVLSWARDTAGFAREDIVKKLNQRTVVSDTIEAWEEGTDQPTYTQLEKLAEFYKRPLALFFFPEPPNEEKIQTKLRSVPESYVQELSPEIRFIIRKALVRQMDLYELYAGIIPNDFANFMNNVGTINIKNAKLLAARLRKIMGVSLEEQFSWKTPNEALKIWRQKLEKLGIWVFKDAFKDDDCSGFCLPDEAFPVVYLNNSMSETRRIFSLFHELGHLLIAKGGIHFRTNVSIEFEGQYQQEEIFCNAFAGSFLVPNDDFVVAKNPNNKEISNYANQYKVSREVILRKYLNKKFITQEFYNKKIKEWKESYAKKIDNLKRINKENKKKSGPSFYVTQKAYLGKKYLELTFSKYYKQQINEDQLADYLGLKIKSLGSIEEYMLKTRD